MANSISIQLGTTGVTTVLQGIAVTSLQAGTAPILFQSGKKRSTEKHPIVFPEPKRKSTEKKPIVFPEGRRKSTGKNAAAFTQ